VVPGAGTAPEDVATISACLLFGSQAVAPRLPHEQVEAFAADQDVDEPSRTPPFLTLEVRTPLSRDPPSVYIPMMATTIALFALIPLPLDVVLLVWVYKRRDDDPEWRR
jgi:hypothetical protein